MLGSTRPEPALGAAPGGTQGRCLVFSVRALGRTRDTHENEAGMPAVTVPHNLVALADLDPVIQVNQMSEVEDAPDETWGNS